MKSMITLIVLIFSLSAFAGTRTMSNILSQPEVEELEAKLNKAGYVLTKVQDNFANSGMVPRCPCSSFDLTFARGRGDKVETKTYNVYAQGYANPQITVSPSR